MKQVEHAIFNKYIRPTQNNHNDFIGIEIELPLVNLKKKAVNFDDVYSVTKTFIEHFDFEVTGIDDSGYIYSCSDSKTGDILSYDCSYNNLELSMGKEKDLNCLNQRFRKYFRYLQQEMNRFDIYITGMGINPYREYNRNVPIENERYRMLFHHLASYKKYNNLPKYFHSYPMYGTFSSASQVQLDVKEEDLIQTIRAFTKLEPIKAILFSNSPFDDMACCRDYFWEHSTHGINLHNIGMFEKLPESAQELQSYIESQSMYCVMREGKYINFSPIPLYEYFRSESIEGEYFENGTYHTISFNPQIEDIEFHRTFKFVDLTFRGTIEYRSVCSQPIKDAMCMPAFHIGLKEKLNELDHVLENDTILYHRGYTASELRKLFTKIDFPSNFDKDEVYSLVKQVVDIAKKGLEQRNLGEEVFLDPLYERIQRRQNPAQRMLEMDLETAIKKYGELD